MLLILSTNVDIYACVKSVIRRERKKMVSKIFALSVIIYPSISWRYFLGDFYGFVIWFNKFYDIENLDKITRYSMNGKSGDKKLWTMFSLTDPCNLWPIIDNQQRPNSTSKLKIHIPFHVKLSCELCFAIDCMESHRPDAGIKYEGILTFVIAIECNDWTYWPNP